MEITDDMNKIAGQIAELYRSNIKEGAYATGELSRFTWTTRMSGEMFMVEFTVPKYWKWSPENERKGHKQPPTSAIEEWLKIKKLPVPTTKKGVPNYRGAAYCIARAIGKRGWKYQPLKLLDKSMKMAENQGLIDELVNIIAEKMIKENIEKDINEL